MALWAKKFNPILTDNCLQILFHSMIHSHINYCVNTWCHGNTLLINKIQKISNKFIRMIKPDNNILPMFLTINQTLLKHTALFMFCYHNKSLPNVFNNFFLTPDTKK